MSSSFKCPSGILVDSVLDWVFMVVWSLLVEYKFVPLSVSVAKYEFVVESSGVLVPPLSGGFSLIVSLEVGDGVEPGVFAST